MADNRHYAGFRFLRSKSGADKPVIERRALASGYLASTLIGAATINKTLKKGDPVKLVSTGYVELAEGTEHDTDGTALYGVIAGFETMYSSSQGKMIFTDKYPLEGVTYGTNFDRQTTVLVIPAHTAYFEIDADDKTTATTYAAYLAFIGENALHLLNATDNADCDTMLDISTHAVTADLLWRITGVNQYHPDNQDFSGLYVKLEVTGNRVQDPSITAAGETGV